MTQSCTKTQVLDDQRLRTTPCISVPADPMHLEGCRYRRPFLMDRHCNQNVGEQPARTNREVPHLRCSKRCPSWAGMQMDQAPAPEASCFPPNVISRTAR